MNNEINYDKLFNHELENISKLSYKPTLFLHACCGPCLTYPYSILTKYFDVTVGFFNPNIYPLSEYNLRLENVKKFLDEYSKKNNIKYQLITSKEDFEKYDKELISRSKDIEGGKACLLCHRYRLELSYKYAYENKFDYFTSVMTVSCKKPSKELNEIAFELEKKYKTTKYLYSDFKKNNGQLIGINIAKEYSLYRQNYCGCKYSLIERDKRLLNRK